MKKTTIIGIAALAIVAGAGCFGKGGNTVGKVFGTKISKDDLNSAIWAYGTTAAPQVLVRTQSGETQALLAEPIAFQALRQYVLRMVMLQLAKEDGVMPTAEDVNKELDFRSKLNSGYLTQMTAQGLNVSQVKQMIEFDLAKERLITNGVTVTLDEAKKFYEANKSQFADPPRAQLLWILVSDKKKQAEVDQQLGLGLTFGMVAEKYSEDQYAVSRHGAFPETDLNKMPRDIRAMVDGMPAGTAGKKWLDAGPGKYAKFFLVSKTPAKDRPLDDAHLEQLRRSMAINRGIVAKDLNNRVLEKLKAAGNSISVDDSSLKRMWDDWLNSVMKAAQAAEPATKASGTGTAPSGATPPGTGAQTK